MSDEQETHYSDIRHVIQRELDRDGQHDWDEAERLTDVIAPAVWNEIHTFPLAQEASAGAAPIDVDQRTSLEAKIGLALGEWDGTLDVGGDRQRFVEHLADRLDRALSG